MYSIVKVTRPGVDVAQLVQLSDNYRLLAAAASAAHAEASGAVTHVLDPSLNSGTEVVEAFRGSVTGAGSVTDQFDKLAKAAHATRVAYHTAAIHAKVTLVHMDLLAHDGGQAFSAALRDPLNGWPTLPRIALEVRSRMLRTEQEGAAAVAAAFDAVSLPAELSISTAESWGALPDEIVDLWESLDEGQRRDLLQRLADEYADAHGIPRRTIDFTTDISAWGVRRGDGSIAINETLMMSDGGSLSSAYMLHVIIHEMEHSWQYEVMESNDPTEYGVSHEERDRIVQRNQPEVRAKGRPDGWQPGDPDPSYTPRPVEVGARRAGRDFLDDLTIQELEEMVP